MEHRRENGKCWLIACEAKPAAVTHWLILHVTHRRVERMAMCLPHAQSLAAEDSARRRCEPILSVNDVEAESW